MKNLKYILLMMGIALFAACSSEEDEVKAPVIDLTDAPIVISTNVNSHSTRAGYSDDNSLHQSTFGLFLTTVGNNKFDLHAARYQAYNLEFKYLYGSNEWVTTSGMQLLWKSTTSKVKYYAYMPFDTLAIKADSTANKAYPVRIRHNQASSTDSVLASDYLYAPLDSALGSDDNGQISIEFQHIMSKFELLVTKGTEVERYNVDSIFLDTCVALTSTYDLIDSTLNNATDMGAQDSSIKFYDNSDVKRAAGELGTADNDFEAIVLPQTFVMRIKVHMSNGKVYVYQATAPFTFEPGYKYVLPLKISRDVVEPGIITATAWNTVIVSEELETE